MKDKGLAVGDRVAVLDDVLEGLVTALSGDQIEIETPEGLRVWLPAAELISVGEMPQISNYRAYQEKQMKEETGSGRRLTRSKKGNKGDRILTVDLHLERLPPHIQKSDRMHILDYQLDWTRRQIEFARAKGVPRVIIIHGVGEGVLKEEVLTLLRRMGNIDYADAPYHQYGFGATEALLR